MWIKFRTIAVFLIVFSCLLGQSSFSQLPLVYFTPPFLTTDKSRPVHLRYLGFDSEQNNFQLLLDKGDIKDVNPVALQETTQKLVDYFLIGLILPNELFWVNLRPDQGDNVIDPFLEKTDIGKILLEADLSLKKSLALATSSETTEGKEYWERLYAKAEDLFGGKDVSLPTYTRPWIVPGEIVIRSSEESVYIYKATLKVMLEQDYLKGQNPAFDDVRIKELNDYSSTLIRQLIIPKLTREVNTSKRYAQLRQLYYSLILSQWFKTAYRRDREARQVFSRIDNKGLTGLTSKTAWSKDTYFQRYKHSFQKGEYNQIETVNTVHGQTIRQYISGGLNFSDVATAEQKIWAGINAIENLLRLPFLEKMTMTVGVNGQLVVNLPDGGKTGKGDNLPGPVDTTDDRLKRKELPSALSVKDEESLRKIKAAVDRMMKQPAVSNGDEEIFEDISNSPTSLHEEVSILLKRLLSHPDGRIIFLAIQTLERIRQYNPYHNSYILDIYTDALNGNNENAHSDILDDILRIFALRTPAKVTVDMVRGIEKVLKNGSEWPKRYAFHVLCIIASSPETTKEVKEKTVSILKTAIQDEYVKSYPDGQNIGNFLDSWLNNNPFSLQSLRLENVANALVEFRDIQRITTDRQTPYLTGRNDEEFPVAVITMKDRQPDIPEEEFLSSTVSIILNGGSLSEGLIPMRSEGFSCCHAVLIRDKSTGNYLLFHFQEGISGLESWLPLRKYIEYLGAGEKEAIYLANGSNIALNYAESSEEYFVRQFGIKTSRFIKVNSGIEHWSLLFRPMTNQLIVYSGDEAYIFDAFEKEKTMGGISIAMNDKSSGRSGDGGFSKSVRVPGDDKVYRETLSRLKGADQDGESINVLETVKDDLGGIDFRSLFITSRSSPVIKPNPQEQINPGIPSSAIDKEWRDIQKTVSEGNIPSGDRIRKYVLFCCQRENLNKDVDNVIICISEILRLEEDYVVDCEPGFIRFLSILESYTSPQELQIALRNFSFVPQANK